MKKLKLIYNPGAGDKSFKNYIDECLNVFQEGGFDVHIHRSMKRGDVYNHIFSLENRDNYDTIVVCGGDGTINMAVNAIMDKGLNAKLGIIPSGTANDYASYLKLPKEAAQAAKIITNGNTVKTDIGRVNDKYFINVCGAGFLTNISQHIDEEFKNTLGKTAYYIKGIEQMQNFVPMDIRITNSKEVMEESVYFLLILNGPGAGSFENLAPHAKVDDGLFDFLAIKNMNMLDMPKLFIEILKGGHLNNDNVIFFQDEFIKIESIAEVQNKLLLETDIDGELGPDLPVTVKNVPAAIEVYHNRG